MIAFRTGLLWLIIVSLFVISCANNSTPKQPNLPSVHGRDTFKIYIQLNGYRGVLCPYDSFGNSTCNFYAKDRNDIVFVPLLISLKNDTSYYAIDNGTRAGNTSTLLFKRDTATNRISELISPAANASLDSIKVSGHYYSLIKLKTAQIFIKTNQLTTPFELSAFPGVFFDKDTNFMLIENMPYFIENQTNFTINTCTPVKALPFRKRNSSIFYYADTPPNLDVRKDSCFAIDSKFYFGITDSGMVDTYPNNFTATGNKNTLSFNTIPLNINLHKISHDHPIQIKWDNSSMMTIAKDTTIHVINTRLNFLTFSDTSGNHKYYYYNDYAKPNKYFPYAISKGADSIFKTYAHLIAKDHMDTTCNNVVKPDVSSIMPACYYSSMSAPGMVTFISYLQDSETFSTRFDFKYDGFCPPKPVIYNFIRLNSASTNEVRFIPVKAYRGFSGAKDFNTLVKNVRGVRIDSIARIINYQVEPSKGHIDSTENNDYNNFGSAKGIIVNLRMKNGKRLPCYLSVLNDNGSLIWKEINYTINDENISNAKDYFLSIYDCKGQCVFSSHSYYESWDGNYNGTRTLGEYSYTIQYTLNGRKHILSGDFILKR